jgi:hypothetical protein
MSKLTVVYLNDTGHVLAALTRVDPPQGTEQVGALVGTGLPVSSVGGLAADFTVPVQDLAPATVDDQLEVLLNPQGFQVVQDPQGQAPPKVKNVGVPGSSVDLTIAASSGAAVKVTGVSSPTTLQAVVVLQNVTTPNLAATILPTVTVTVGTATPVSGNTGFVTGEKWNMYAFVQGLSPTAKEVPVT